jgi:hypothetical protein
MTHPMPGRQRRPTAAWPALALLVLAHPAAAQDRGPALQLFPTNVIEDIRETGEVAEAMEQGLQDVIGRLDAQQQLYMDSKCDGAVDDPGCDQLARQLGATYLEMLHVMGDRLPDMEHAVNSTRQSLERRLKSELGQGMTPWQLQETLLGSSPEAKPPREPKLRGRSGLRLSERFAQYYRLVATSGGASAPGLPVIASDIYLDMAEASVLIAQTREEIARATLMEELNQSFGAITPEMQSVVDGVKTILFGESAAMPAIAGPPDPRDEQEFASELAW